MDGVSHAFIAELIGGTYALTLGSYLFTWVFGSRLERRIEQATETAMVAAAKIDMLRDNHVKHLETRVTALEELLQGATQAATDEDENPYA